MRPDHLPNTTIKPLLVKVSEISFLALKSLIYNDSGNFPGGPMAKNPPSNTGDAGLIPGWGIKIPHAAGQVSPHATTTDPVCHKLQSPHVLEPECHNQREKTLTPHLERRLHAARKIPCATTKTRHNQKKKKTLQGRGYYH